uniref:Uncharacterized protein n=1 Tax=Rhizophora mucronata TaxID=61149 RepID=A0A2P2M5A5_RHIMU
MNRTIMKIANWVYLQFSSLQQESNNTNRTCRNLNKRNNCTRGKMKFESISR